MQREKHKAIAVAGGAVIFFYLAQWRMLVWSERIIFFSRERFFFFSSFHDLLSQHN